MKIQVDGIDLFQLNEIQKKVIQNDIPKEIFDEDMKRRLKWVLFDEKYQRCLERLRKEWEPKLKARGVEAIPTNDNSFAELVFSQNDYLDRSARDASSKN